MSPTATSLDDCWAPFLGAASVVDVVGVDEAEFDGVEVVETPLQPVIANAAIATTAAT